MREIMLFRKSATQTIFVNIDILHQTAVDMATHLHVRSPQVVVMAGVTENRQLFIFIHYAGPHWNFRAEGPDFDSVLKDYMLKLSTNIYKSQKNG